MYGPASGKLYELRDEEMEIRVKSNRTNQVKIGWTLGVAMFLFVSPAWVGAQTIRSFDGDKGLDLKDCNLETNRCRRQPEMDVAVNGKQVVQVTRQNVLVFDYSGKLLRSTSMIDFVRNAGLEPMSPPPKQPSQGGRGPFEPHVVYDEFIGRWIVTITCLNDCLMVSATSDPMGPWGGVYLSCLQGGTCLSGDPALHIGYDKNGMYYCGGHLGGDNPDTPKGVAYDCLAVPSAEVKAIEQGTAPAHINRHNDMPLDIVPAIDHNRLKAANAPAFFAAKTCARTPVSACQYSTNFPFNWVVDTLIWNGTTAIYNSPGGQQVVKTDIGSKQNKWLYSTPCCGATAAIPQAGSDIPMRIAESHRFLNLVQFGTHLLGALGSGPCTGDCGVQGVDANNVMFWVDLDCSKPAACVVS